MSKHFDQIILNITIPIILRSRKKAPERCVRNLMELGENMNIYINADEKNEVNKALQQLCIEGTQQQIIDYFYKVYVKEL
ncbi:hypothetical protein [Anaerosporobacter sp.]